MPIPYDKLGLTELRTVLASLQEVRFQCSFIDHWPDAQRCQRDADVEIGKVRALIQKRQLELVEADERVSVPIELWEGGRGSGD